MDASELAHEDRTETHDGITWVWFRAENKWDLKPDDVIGLRIVDGAATLVTSSAPSQASDLRRFGAAWSRCMRFLECNSDLRLVG